MSRSDDPVEADGFELMAPLIPIGIVVVAALIGAALIGFTFKRVGRRSATGGVVGAAAGAIGSLIFMLPLNFCTFEAERTSADAAIGLFLIALGLVIVLWPLQWFIRRRAEGNTLEMLSGREQPGAFKGWLTPLILLAPTLTILLLFLYYPSLDTLRLSTLLARLGAPRSKFICMDNFTSLIGDSAYARSVGISFIIAIGIIVIGLGLSLLIATMANQPIRGANIYRTLLIWPYAISPAVAGVIFFLMFSPITGMINHVLGQLFGINPPWLSDPALAPWTIIMASVWKSMGFNILFYIAGLQNVPADLKEAAAIDGANAWQRFSRIVFPMLSPITFFLIVTNITYSFFDIFGTIDLLTRGGPAKATSTMIYNIYVTGITDRDLGKAAAQSIFLFVMVVALTVYQFRSTGRRVNYGA